MLVLALRAAKYSTWSACDKSFGTMPAKLNRVFAVGQHKAEHHLNSKHERVKIPNNRRLIQKGYMISWSDAAKCRHALLHHLPGFIVQCIIILIIKETVDIGKRPVDELLFYPFISLRIFPLKAHVDRHRLICHGQSQCHHNTVILDVPHGLDTTLDHIQFVKAKDLCQKLFTAQSIFYDEVVFRQIHRLIFHKVWCGR